MQNANNTTETQTQTQADVEKELDLDLFDIVDTLEMTTTDLENIQTLINEIGYDLQYEIKYDGTKEDEQRKANLLNRRPVMERFLLIALDYVIKSHDTIKETCNNLWEYIKQEE